MTVGEMIDVLKGYPGDLRVVVNGYERRRLRRRIAKPHLRQKDPSEHGCRVVEESTRGF